MNNGINKGQLKNRRKKVKNIFAIFALLSFSLSLSSASAENSCHSGGTKWDGDTSSCDGQVCVQAYQLNPLTAVVTKTNGYGGKHECHEPRIVETQQDGWNTRVTKVCASFYARSPSGMSNKGKRGTVRCRLDVAHRDHQ